MGKRGNRKTLTEGEWDRVFRIRCKTKQGQAITDDERALVDSAYQSDPKRYGSLEPAVFDATVPFGSAAKWGSK